VWKGVKNEKKWKRTLICAGDRKQKWIKIFFIKMPSKLNSLHLIEKIYENLKYFTMQKFNFKKSS
jgi:hypothetical protein